jgi:hypothetical protein
MKYYCTANLYLSDHKRTRCFTAGKFYTVIQENSDAFPEPNVVLIDDQKEEHTVCEEWLKHFEKLS